MKSVRIPMSATRAVRLSKALTKNGVSVAILLEEGLKNLKEKDRISYRKV